MTVAHLLDGDDAMLALELRNLAGKGGLNGGGSAVQEHHRTPLAAHLHFDLVSVDGEAHQSAGQAICTPRTLRAVSGSAFSSSP